MHAYQPTANSSVHSASTRSKAKVCCALTLLLALAVIVCIAVAARRKCPAGTFTNAAVAADSKICSEVAR